METSKFMKDRNFDSSKTESFGSARNSKEFRHAQKSSISDKQENKEKQVHWPTLNTVMMVEETLKKMNESVISVADLKRKLPRQVNHITLMVILEYLERSNKIAATLKGITWIENNNLNLKKAILQGMEI